MWNMHTGMRHFIKALQETVMVFSLLSYYFKKRALVKYEWGAQMPLLVPLMFLVILSTLQEHGFITTWVSVMTQLKKCPTFPYLPILSTVDVTYNILQSGIHETKRSIHSHTNILFSFLWLNKPVMVCRVWKSRAQRIYVAGFKGVICPAVHLDACKSGACSCRCKLHQIVQIEVRGRGCIFHFLPHSK